MRNVLILGAEYNEIKQSKKIISESLYRNDVIFATNLAEICGNIVYEIE